MSKEAIDSIAMGYFTLTPNPSPTPVGEGRCCIPLPYCRAR